MTPRESDASAVVFHFLTYEYGHESPRVSTFKATLDAIRRHFRGLPLDGTAEAVAPGELDAMGRWRRQATGWGDLSRLN
jgi:hypothetical protein